MITQLIFSWFIPHNIWRLELSYRQNLTFANGQYPVARSVSRGTRDPRGVNVRLSKAFKLALLTIAVMLTAIVLIAWGIVLSFGGPANALLYLFIFGDAGLLITVIEIARRKKKQAG